MTREFDLVDIGGGNIGSISRCLQRLDVPFRTADPDRPPDGSRPMIVPGVGAFGAVMDHLMSTGLDIAIRNAVRGGTPCLGICVGMQILFDSSTESPGVRGLGLIAGEVTRFNAPKVPQIGWNFVTAKHDQWPSGYVYFVNSYYVKPADDDAVLYEASYGDQFCAAVETNGITAFQFHPEKSSAFGQQLLQRWVDRV